MVQFRLFIRGDGFCFSVKTNIISRIFILDSLAVFLCSTSCLMFCALIISVPVIFASIIFSSIFICLLISSIFICHSRIVINLTHIVNRIYITTMLIL